MAIQIRELSIKAEIRGRSAEDGAKAEAVTEETVRRIIRDIEHRTPASQADDNTSRRER